MATPTGSARVPALIFGSHIAALGVLRVLAAHHVPCLVVDDTTDIITRSRWYRRPERTLAETADPDVLAAYLRALPLERGVLIACSDRWSTAVAGLPDDLRERFPASIPPADAVARFVDKRRFARLVEELDIPRPRTLVVRSPDDLASLGDAELADGFLKPVEPARYFAIFGTKGEFAADRSDAEAHVREAAAHGIELLFQEWIPGPPSRTILLDGFVDRQGEIAALVARRRLRMDPPRIANTHLDVTIPTAEVADAVEHARRMLAAVAYRGIFNIEFKWDERDGRHKIIELNPRPFWLIAHISAAGAELPWLSYLDALELPVPRTASYQVGRFGMYEVPEIWSLVRAWSHLRRPDGPVIRPWLTADHIDLYWSDPLPGLFDLGRAVRRRLGAITSGIASRRPRAAAPSALDRTAGPT